MNTKNQEPRTKNQEPRTKNQEPRTKNQVSTFASHNVGFYFGIVTLESAHPPASGSRKPQNSPSAA